MNDERPEGEPRDWTDGPARWAAVVVLGAASIFGMAWSIGWRMPIAPAATVSAPSTSRVDINAAGEAELQLLPGIGPALAARIVADRAANGPFGRVEDLMRVQGIGPKTVARLEPMAVALPRGSR